MDIPPRSKHDHASNDKPGASNLPVGYRELMISMTDMSDSHLDSNLGSYELVLPSMADPFLDSMLDLSPGTGGTERHSPQGQGIQTDHLLSLGDEFSFDTYFEAIDDSSPAPSQGAKEVCCPPGHANGETLSRHWFQFHSQLLEACGPTEPIKPVYRTLADGAATPSDPSVDVVVNSTHSPKSPSPLMQAIYTGIKALTEVRICWRCKILGQKCDSSNPCKSCPSLHDVVPLRDIGCRRGSLWDEMPATNMCPKSLVDASEKQPSQTTRRKLGAQILESAEGVHQESMERLAGILSNPHDTFEKVLLEVLCPTIDLETSSRLKMVSEEDSVLCTIWELLDNPSIRDVMHISSLEDIADLLNTSLAFEKEHSGASVISCAVSCLKYCVQALRLQCAGVLSPYSHEGCSKDGCQLDCVDKLTQSINSYAKELSKEILHRDQPLDSDRRWWLSCFYSLCIQAHVRFGVMAIQSQLGEPQTRSWGTDLGKTQEGAWKACKGCRRRYMKCDGRFPCSNCVKTGQGCSIIEPKAISFDFLHLAIDLFETASKEYDPLGTHWELENAPEVLRCDLHLLKYYRAAQRALRTSTWAGSCIHGSCAYLNMLFERSPQQTNSLSQTALSNGPATLAKKRRAHSPPIPIQGVPQEVMGQGLAHDRVRSLSYSPLSRASFDGNYSPKAPSGRFALGDSTESLYELQGNVNDLSFASRGSPASAYSGDFSIPRASPTGPSTRLSPANGPGLLLAPARPYADRTYPGVTVSRSKGLYMCECCPKKPKKFESYEDLRDHEASKVWECPYCANRFKNKNECERHIKCLHVRRYKWSCSALESYEQALHESVNQPGRADICGFCGKEFARTGRTDNPLMNLATVEDLEVRILHLQEVHKFRECNQSKSFFRADHFRQHLKHSHAGQSGRWTNVLESTCTLKAEGVEITEMLEPVERRDIHENAPGHSRG